MQIHLVAFHKKKKVTKVKKLQFCLISPKSFYMSREGTVDMLVKGCEKSRKNTKRGYMGAVGVRTE